MALTRIVSRGITDGTITGDDINSTFNLTGKTVTLPAGVGGKVLQVVNATYDGGASSSSSTFADTGLTASITPSSASNKILILIEQAGIIKSQSDTNLDAKLLRGSTDLIKFTSGEGYTGNSNVIYTGNSGASYLDTPNTTSSTTYKTQFRSANNTAFVLVQTNNSVSTITLIEIAV